MKSFSLRSTGVIITALVLFSLFVSCEARTDEHHGRKGKNREREHKASTRESTISDFFGDSSKSASASSSSDSSSSEDSCVVEDCPTRICAYASCFFGQCELTSVPAGSPCNGDGVCNEDGECEAAAAGCTNDGDCGGGTPICSETLPGNFECVECEYGDDCDPGENCVDYACEAAGDCMDDGDCGGGTPICSETSPGNFECVECESVLQCTAGQDCIDFACEAIPECTDNDDCDNGNDCEIPICDFGSCANTDRDGEDCDGGDGVCNSSDCVECTNLDISRCAALNPPGECETSVCESGICGTEGYSKNGQTCSLGFCVAGNCEF